MCGSPYGHPAVALALPRACGAGVGRISGVRGDCVQTLSWPSEDSAGELGGV